MAVGWERELRVVGKKSGLSGVRCHQETFIKRGRGTGMSLHTDVVEVRDVENEHTSAVWSVSIPEPRAPQSGCFYLSLSCQSSAYQKI